MIVVSLCFVHVSGVNWRLCQGGVGGCFSGSLLLDVKYFGIVFGISVGASGAIRERSSFVIYFSGIDHTSIHYHIRTRFSDQLSLLLSFLNLSLQTLLKHTIDQYELMLFFLFLPLFLSFGHIFLLKLGES